MNKDERREHFLHAFHKVAPISQILGMKLSFDDGDQAIVDLPNNPDLYHAYGAVHGGIYATLLDTAGWFTAAMSREETVWMVTSEMSIHFLKPATGRALKATARVIKQGNRQDIVEMFIHDDKGDLAGHATGTFVLLENLPMDQLFQNHIDGSQTK